MSPDRKTPHRPDGLADGLDALADTLDDLAVAFNQDPDTVARLLTTHAAHVAALDLAAVNYDATDATRAMRAAEVASSREALLEQITSDQLADVIPLAAARTAQNGHSA
ncbi:hypothetical protein ACFCXS_15445 [Streptomyces sp. NPDC056373]|uniref:hypothetical protein n=1 Tax=Streptomyces sp. NPDC056373 TaxID=3345798 RepID=UPI0035DD4396